MQISCIQRRLLNKFDAQHMLIIHLILIFRSIFTWRIHAAAWQVFMILGTDTSKTAACALPKHSMLLLLRRLGKAMV